MFDLIRETVLARRSVSGVTVVFAGLLIISLTILSCGGSDDDNGGVTLNYAKLTFEQKLDAAKSGYDFPVEDVEAIDGDVVSEERDALPGVSDAAYPNTPYPTRASVSFLRAHLDTGEAFSQPRGCKLV